MASPDLKSEEQPKLSGFGSFKVALQDLLTVTVVLRLATYFEYPPAVISQLNTNVASSASSLMITLMEEKGLISSKDISQLLNALNKLKYYGILDKVREIFETSTGITTIKPSVKTPPKGKTETFLNYLRATYKLWYNKIQPIPYIREKIFCVDDVYVETGIEILQKHPSNIKVYSEGSPSTRLTSYREVFDERISSNRIVLQGDPGYGKSCFTLQAAYDWCTKNVLSPLSHVSIFILLPLRLLGGIPSIGLAIKLLLMPAESKLSESEIMDIINSHSSVLIVLDGYDEYPDKDSDTDTEVIRLTKGTMFANYKVITCTRSSCLPKDIDPSTVFLNMTGFDDEARDEYIRRVVVRGNDLSASNKIKHLLNSSPVMGDICQVPLFCVMFAHIAHDSTDLIKFTSVTTFFKYMLSCFYNHMWKKPGNKHFGRSNPSPADHSKLNKVAFLGLTGSVQQIVWNKDEFKKSIRKDCYDELIEIGILIEEEVLEINDTPGVTFSQHIRLREIVRFYHKLFAEWYAANYLAYYAGGLLGLGLTETFKSINPMDLQFVFRFACGLNKKASERIIAFLRAIEDGQSFALLCFLEQSDIDSIIDIVRPMCSDGITIRVSNSRLLQRSTIQILDVASKSQFAVPRLHLEGTFNKIDGNNLILNCGLGLPCPMSVAVIEISQQYIEPWSQTWGNEDKKSEEFLVKLLRYVFQSQTLEKLKLRGYQLPMSFSPELFSGLTSRNAKVTWDLHNYEFNLSLQSGKWKIDDIEAIKKACSGGVSFKEMDIMERQIFTILLLESASYHDVNIPCLQFLRTFNFIDGDTVCIHPTGLTVKCPSSVATIQFTARDHEGTALVQSFRSSDSTNPVHKRELTQEELIRIFKYALQSKTLKSIIFESYILPLLLAPALFPQELQSREVEVFWHFYKQKFYLELKSWQWKQGDVKLIRKLSSETVTIKKSHNRSKQLSNVQLLVIAANHGIPVPCLHLDKSFETIDNDGHILLQSGISLPKVLVTSIEITKDDEYLLEDEDGSHRDIREREVDDIINLGLKSPTFGKLSFRSCSLPHFITVSNDDLKSGKKDLEVLWQPFNRTFQLDAMTGKWQVEIKDIKDLCSRGIFIEKSGNRLQQLEIVQVLIFASDHKIFIGRLCLRDSISKVDSTTITLISGVRLPALSSVRSIDIDEKGREMAEEEVAGILSHANQSQEINELKFFNCLLPMQVPGEDVRESLRSRNVSVYWYPYISKSHNYQLHLHSGQWLKGGCDEITESEYRDEVKRFRNEWRFTVFQNRN